MVCSFPVDKILSLHSVLAFGHAVEEIGCAVVLRCHVASATVATQLIHRFQACCPKVFYLNEVVVAVSDNSYCYLYLASNLQFPGWDVHVALYA